MLYRGSTSLKFKNVAGQGFPVPFFVTQKGHTQEDLKPPPSDILYTNPSNGSTGVGVYSNITVAFSKEMNTGTLNKSTFTITRNDTGVDITSDISYSSGQKIVTLNPTSYLEPGTSHTAILTTGVSDIDGSPLSSDYSWTFTAGYPPDYTDPVTDSITFVWIKKGCYQMGDSSGDSSTGEDIVHPVCIDGFYLSQYETRSGEWLSVMKSDPSVNATNWFYPVDSVSKSDVVSFITTINSDSKSDGRYRLPTEAEWEYACRSQGGDVQYGTSTGELKNGSSFFANYFGGDDGYDNTAPVQTFPSNSVGLYSMAGNIREWVQDTYSSSFYGIGGDATQNNPVNNEDGFEKVMRGGGYLHTASNLTCSVRLHGTGDTVSADIGFRLAKNL